jgi:transcriptional regulator with XRE-family HTH domain
MIKQFVARPRQQRAAAAVASDVGSAVWMTVGRRLQRRRTGRGYSVDRVAHWAAIPAETYESYERGEPIPAALLAQIADLFEVPLVWFFQGIGEDDSHDDGTDREDDGERKAGPAIYQVATIEHRIAALVESFRKLDFEGQQHLLAISRELSRAARE